jgi:hypothetical protein
MSQHTARQDTRAKSEDEDVADTGVRPPAHQPVSHRAVGPDDPDADEFQLVGDDDLGAADLGPVSPAVSDPDAGSGRARKITRQNDHRPPSARA